MNPDPIIQSEVSQKNKNKHHKLIHIYGNQNGANEPIGRAAMDTQT